MNSYLMYTVNAMTPSLKLEIIPFPVPSIIFRCVLFYKKMSQWPVNHAVPGVTGIGDESKRTYHVCYRCLRASLEDLDEGFGSVTGLRTLFFFKNC